MDDSAAMMRPDETSRPTLREPWPAPRLPATAPRARDGRREPRAPSRRGWNALDPLQGWTSHDLRAYRRGLAWRGVAQDRGLWHPGCGRIADEPECRAALLEARAVVMLAESREFAAFRPPA